MIETYLINVFKFCLSRIEKDSWLYDYINHIYIGLNTLKNNRISSNYKYLEQEPTYLKYFLEYQIRKIQDLSKDIMDTPILENYIHFIEYLLDKSEQEEYLKIIETLFYYKNNTKYHDSEWFVPLSFYKKEDIIDYIEKGNESLYFKNYLFFLDSIDTLIKKNVNPFDPNQMIPLQIFHNMLIKICSYSNFVITLNDLNRIKYKLLS